MTRKFEEGKLYVKYAKGYKVIYRITKRTSKKIYFYSVAVETDEPISKFNSTLCNRSGMPGLFMTLAKCLKKSQYTLVTHILKVMTMRALQFGMMTLVQWTFVL